MLDCRPQLFFISQEETEWKMRGHFWHLCHWSSFHARSQGNLGFAFQGSFFCRFLIGQISFTANQNVWKRSNCSQSSWTRTTLDYSIWRLNSPLKRKKGRKGAWEPSYASDLTLNFGVLIRPYWPGQLNSLIKDIQIDLCYQNQNIRGRVTLVCYTGIVWFCSTAIVWYCSTK